MKKLVNLLCVSLLFASLVGCSKPEQTTISKTVKGYGGDLSVDVTFENDKITKVEVTSHSETDGIGTRAIDELPSAIVNANGTEVDIVSGATVTSDAIITAVNLAVKEYNNEEATISYTPGKYQGSAKGYGGEVVVEVEFSENEILNIEILSNNDTYGIGYGMPECPFETLPQEILEVQGLGVDTVTGATLSSNALLQAVGQAAVEAGADLDVLNSISKQTAKMEDEVYDVDVVVVGAGAAGLSAGISAAYNDADVLVLEKQGIVGGATTRSGGKILAAGTHIQNEEGIVDNDQMMYEYLKSVGGDYIDDEKLKAFTDNALDVYNWMEEIGVEVIDAEPIHSSITPNRVHNTLGGGGMTSGWGGNITVPLYNTYNTADGDIIYNTTVNEIIVNDNNEVVGVKGVRPDGSTVTVNAKSVIIATGGYASNKDMVESYGKPFDFYVTNVPAGNVGDGITMVENLGGQIYDNPAVQVVYVSFSSGVGINEEPGLIVSDLGNRVANEYTYQFHVGDALAKQNSNKAWYIATSNDITPTVQYAMSLDSTLKASSVEELASLMGVDAANLQTTIDRYNSLAAKGNDEDFGKPSEFMYPIEGEMYYAIELMPSVTVTYSGIVTDVEAQVLDNNNQPIKNLYAVGETAFPGLFGTEYPGCGMAISSGSYYGLIAGENAANNSK